MSTEVNPNNRQTDAAHQAVLELIRSSGSELFKNRHIDGDSGRKAAECVIAFHKALSDHYKTLE